MQKPIVQVVPIIDTEGPTTGRHDLFDTWPSIMEAMDILVVKLRNRLVDSFGHPAIYSWFILDWTGYSLNDPIFRRRGHVSRLHGIWDFYRRNLLTDANLAVSGDGIYWHYHHPPKDGSWGWNDKWGDGNWHEYILAKRMLDFGFFPAIYRAGKYVENNENSHWLERWIPVDFSSISPVRQEFCDWSRAPSNWQPYYPSFEDYQRPGTMKRLVARSLPVAAKGGSGALREEDIVKAFIEAKEKGKALLSFHSHDYYKSILDDFTVACGMVEKMSHKFNVPWKFFNALEASRSYLTPTAGNFLLSVTRDEQAVSIFSNHAIFGEMPFVVFEYANGEVKREDAERKGEMWTVSIPDSAVRLAVGAADRYGNTDVKILNLL